MLLHQMVSYLGMLKTRPVLTKSVTSSLIYIAADLCKFHESGGWLILGPTLHYWFNLMSRLFPKRDLITTFKKMAMGQTVYGPNH